MVLEHSITHQSTYVHTITYEPRRTTGVCEPGKTYEGEPSPNEKFTSISHKKFLRLHDELELIFSANCFYFEAVEALIAQHRLDISSEANSGLVQNTLWLKEQQADFLKHMNGLLKKSALC